MSFLVRFIVKTLFIGPIHETNIIMANLGSYASHVALMLSDLHKTEILFLYAVIDLPLH